MILRRLAATAFLLAASPTLAQEPAAPPAGEAPPAAAGPRSPGGAMVGLGVNVREVDLLSGATTIFVPIQLASGLRLEPEIGLALTGDVTLLRLGLGAFRTWSVAPQVLGYLGGRGQLAYADAGLETTALRLAAAAGAEWAPVPRVALGVEAQAGIVLLDEGIAFGVDDTGVSTSGLAILRVFLW